MKNVYRSLSSIDPWNKGKLVGQKLPLKLREVWAIRIRLQIADRFRDLALFNLAIDRKLRACDLVSLKVHDVSLGSQILKRAKIVQQKTHQPVQFEITHQTGNSLSDWIKIRGLTHDSWLFPSRANAQCHISTRQYSRIVHQWIESIGLDTTLYGTHSLRRTKVVMIYRETGNLRAIQLLLGHTKLESTVRYLGIDVDDALDLAEKTEV
ncbi:tyrosine-type recombinase/integrase [Marinimicrobium sp. C6131]|uniref:tyrosine-type recombinase/integrase n=1 Tax=Marinimicrobium sp. C6131 TaxID=3022676 RepID=UPI00223E6B5D|nr:tyrosine-type recombinase/integrase [Marinimicrobium sp. C6131]UZJ42924.1 tyrosine-type recombinase/integrase [Marinimicrobium sp. C6131]